MTIGIAYCRACALLALVLDGDHDHIGLMDQVGGGEEHCRWLPFLNIKFYLFY
jgi:hypothetical protein